MIPQSPTTYKTIGEGAGAEFKDRGSKFLAYTCPVTNKEEVKKYVALLKKEHPKAAHHCYAYRLGASGLLFRAVDDGEPSGTAGKPILRQIDSKELSDTLVVVVRYFGGTLLGVAGLVNAYKTAASLALQCSRIIEKSVMVRYTLEFAYPEMDKVMRILKKYQCDIINSDQQLFCKFLVDVPVIHERNLLSAMEQIPGIQLNKVDKPNK